MHLTPCLKPAKVPHTPGRHVDFKEESVPVNPEQLLFSLFAMNVSATGTVALIVGVALSILIVAIAWRVAKST